MHKTSDFLFNRLFYVNFLSCYLPVINAINVIYMTIKAIIH